MAAVLTLSVGPDLAAAVRTEKGDLSAHSRCRQWASREVEVRDMKLREVTLAATGNRVITSPRLPGWQGGITLPGLMLLEQDASVHTWLHEHVHHVQLQQDGRLRFSATYLSDYIRGRWKGCGAHDSYLAIGYEIEARRIEHALYTEQHAQEKRADDAPGIPTLHPACPAENPQDPCTCPFCATTATAVAIAGRIESALISIVKPQHAAGGVSGGTESQEAAIVSTAA